MKEAEAAAVLDAQAQAELEAVAAALEADLEKEGFFGRSLEDSVRDSPPQESVQDSGPHESVLDRVPEEEEYLFKDHVAEIAMEQASDNLNFNNTSCFSVCQARLFNTVSGPCVGLGSSR